MPKKVIGIAKTINEKGVTNTTLDTCEEYPPYFSNAEAGRTCDGVMVERIYVGAYDCSKIKVGMFIDISYDKAITTSKGTYQPIKRIDIMNNA